jgi:atlastin
MSDDVVLVEHVDAAEDDVPALHDEDTTATVVSNEPKSSEDTPQALQIVSIGTEENAYAFTFHEEALNKILSRIPPGWKVAVVSVVGAFRTGKSFLLSWFLRYLHYLQQSAKPEGEKWYEQFSALGHDGFDWRGGSERNTTGIWIWSHPHVIVNEKTGEQLAVLLVDTQGMFDHETTMALTASIFGLSTLLSSYQIYNVDKRIQEDNLQQLALFSEYARMAMSKDENDDDDEAGGNTELVAKPFQRMEFLVRDWQHFEEEEDYEVMENEMNDYLKGVISERDAKDLQDTREQIVSCFEKISCYAMTHPGFAVTKKKYNGDVKDLDPIFLHLLDRYCTRVFDLENLQPKVIHGRVLTAAELGSYIKVYAELFASGANFPEAATLLEATASANNTNALQLALAEYKETMDRIAGPHCSNFVRSDELNDEHKRHSSRSLEVFDTIATFGSKGSITQARSKLQEQISEKFEVYASLNDSRNPLAGLET